jgi:hypothetical protein
MSPTNPRRRALVRGAAATPTVAVLPAGSALVADNADVQLLALSAQLNTIVRLGGKKRSIGKSAPRGTQHASAPASRRSSLEAYGTIAIGDKRCRREAVGAARIFAARLAHQPQNKLRTYYGCQNQLAGEHRIFYASLACVQLWLVKHLLDTIIGEPE